MGVPKSGNGGSVSKAGTNIAHVKKWSVTDSTELLPYVSSDTDGNTKREKGNSDWKGTVELYLNDGAVPSITKGDSYAWIFNLDSSNKLSGTARVAEIAYECNVESGELMGVTVSVEANGALT